MSDIKLVNHPYEKPVLILRHWDAELGFVLNDEMSDEEILSSLRALRMCVAQELGKATSFREIKQEIKNGV